VHQLAQLMASDLAADIALDSAVRGIRQSSDDVSVSTQTRQINARRVVMAIPPALLNRIEFAPGLPSSKEILSQRSPMGSVIKVLIAYPTPFWRDSGLNGFTSRTGALLTPTFDVTPPGQANGFLAGFIDADAALEFSARPDGARKEAVLEDLVDLFGSSAGAPLDYHEKNWVDDPWSRGCYGAFMSPGTMSRYAYAGRLPVGRVHWAGTETATEWSGYIEGAIQSGERVAREVLAA